MAEAIKRSEAQAIDKTAYDLTTTVSQAAYVCPIFMVIFPAIKEYNEACEASPLTLAPGLTEVLAGRSPPPFQFLRSLPPAPPKDTVVWSVYAVTATKPGAIDLAYVRVGASEKLGARGRTLAYLNYMTDHSMPDLIIAAHANRYTIKSAGLLAWSPRPTSAMDYFAVRARFFMLEAFFTFIFFALEPTRYDQHVAGLVAWSRTDVAWGPLCTHTSLREKPKAQRFKSEEQAAVYHAKRAERKLAVARYHTRKYRAHQLATNREEYLRQGAANKMRSRMKDPKRDKATMARFRKRTKEAKRLYCEPCDQTFSSIGALELHRTREVHLGVMRMLAGGSKKALNAEQRRNRDWRIRNFKNVSVSGLVIVRAWKKYKSWDDEQNM